MAEVTGARTWQNAGGKKKLPDRIRGIVKDAEARRDMVVFVGSCDLINVTDDKPIFTPEGKFVGMNKGTTLEFHGEVTREYDPNDEEDAQDIENVRKWLNRGRDDRIRRFRIAERPAHKPRAPFKGFDGFSTQQLVDYVAAFAAEEADPEAFIEQCIAYEASKDEPRDYIIEALGGVTEQPEDTDIIEAEVNL